MDASTYNSCTVPCHAIEGLKALEFQLPSQEVLLPPDVKWTSVQALINFNLYNYTIPEHVPLLVSHIITADVLGADHFLHYISQTLCLPPCRFNTSNPYITIKKVVRDRYRLASRVKLEFPPREMCYKCKCALPAEETVLETNLETYKCMKVCCCFRFFHRACLKSANKCPYCLEPWVGLDCCVCRSKCTSKSPFLHDQFLHLLYNRLPCCSMDIHHNCRTKLGRLCPMCNALLEDRVPLIPTTTLEFCARRSVLRKVQFERRELCDKMTSSDKM